ncbi:SDR family oxidoreductase [Mangrovivirga sp. M17]|uniref:SDR family oxidoreductase n=1 Tax=Mangrovivirga halotolerans TaxID=2993936 RepID=A0ABT3RQW1_9BACT|nr:SDR family oxidoreductase [Mangrovivirga halotolerans]MCX2744154.1 SDR family oxidoreductase [Mangrovivirga halotolerans]
MSIKRVLITAAADGIGKVIAEEYLKTGAKVAICDIQEDKIKAFKKKHPDAMAEVCDVGNDEELISWLDQALEFLGGCDTLINNAGIAGPTAPIEEVTPDQVRAVLNIGLVSQFTCIARVLPGMKKQKSGLIINMSSVGGVHAFPNRTPYSAAKRGVLGLNESLAAEVGPYNIRVNAICPGAISGDRQERVIEARAKAEGRSIEEVRKDVLSVNSMRTFIPPEDIAGCILYFDSPAGQRVSGQVISIDGHIPL